MERTLTVFQEFAAYCREAGVTEVKAVGTAAFRDAVNGAEFVRRVRAETGLPLTIISSTEEAHFAASGVLAALDPIPKQSLIVDIGGGSTEFILCRGRHVAWTASYPLGVVQLTERHADDLERQTDIARRVTGVCTDLRQFCAAKAINPVGLTLVGTAGTVTTLAALDLQMTQYDGSQVNNYVMDAVLLDTWYRRLTPLSAAERESLPGMEKGRGDLIMAGLEILLSLLQGLDRHRLVISDFGILEGLLLSLQNRTNPQPFR